MHSESQIMSSEGRKTLISEEIDTELLRRNVSSVLEILHRNTYKNFPPAKLIAVTKTVSPETIQKLKALQILDIGENRVQAAVPKLSKIASDFRLHWIGRLQTNKVKDIIGHVCLLHSMDRLSLAEEVQRHAAAGGQVVKTLVQVNIAGEAQKAGVNVTEVRPFLHKLREFSNVRVKGLMAMMPMDADEAQLVMWFRSMRGLFEQLREEAIEGVDMEELSMGMSGDYAIAAREGATMVRIGTALFRS